MVSFSKVPMIFVLASVHPHLSLHRRDITMNEGCNICPLLLLQGRRSSSLPWQNAKTSLATLLRQWRLRWRKERSLHPCSDKRNPRVSWQKLTKSSANLQRSISLYRRQGPFRTFIVLAQWSPKHPWQAKPYSLIGINKYYIFVVRTLVWSTHNTVTHCRNVSKCEQQERLDKVAWRTMVSVCLKPTA